jgi:hypothetical protein
MGLNLGHVKLNTIMVGSHTSSAADHGFESQSSETKYNNGWQHLVQQIMGLNLSHVKLNTIMVGSFTSSAADHGFESQSRQTKYNNGWQPHL